MKSIAHWNDDSTIEQAFCPVCEAELTPPTRHSCGQTTQAGWGDLEIIMGYTDEEMAEMEAQMGDEPDAEWIRWSQEIDRDIRVAMREFMGGLTNEQYNAWLDAQIEEAGLRFDARGGW